MCTCGTNHDQPTVSRRDLFKHSVIGASTAGLLAQASANAQQPAPNPAQGFGGNVRGGVVFWNQGVGAPDPASILAERQGPGKTTGMKFRALVRSDPFALHRNPDHAAAAPAAGRHPHAVFADLLLDHEPAQRHQPGPAFAADSRTRRRRHHPKRSAVS